jgi:hypothetical protein
MDNIDHFKEIIEQVYITMPFKKIDAGMRNRPFITLEPHKEPDIWETLRGFAGCGLSDVMKKF